MSSPPDRRASERRTRAEPSEPLGRQRQRRQEDRRASYRTVRLVRVIELRDGATHEVAADVSLEGAQYVVPAAVIRSAVELRLPLPDKKELRLPGRVTRIRAQGRSTAVHVRFDELEVRTALALARVLEADVAVTSSSAPTSARAPASRPPPG